MSLKRYRYTGKERDEENGFNYHGARYYAPWLGRWTSCDPLGTEAGVNVYSYVSARPVVKIDSHGTDEKDPPFLKTIIDESGKAAADRLRAFKQLVNHPVDTAVSVGTAIQLNYKINRAGPAGDTPALAAVRAVDQVLDPFSYAARHQRNAQLADSRGQAEVALRERTQEVFSLGDAALMLEGLAKGRRAGLGSAADDASMLREDPEIAKSATKVSRDESSTPPSTDSDLATSGRPATGGASKKSVPEILKQMYETLKNDKPVELQTIKDMVEASGYTIPDEIEFVARDPGKGNFASYAPARGDVITWESYKIDGKVYVSVDPALLKSPLVAMKKMVHELYELEGLKAKLKSTGGMTEQGVSDLINQLHTEAIREEVRARNRWDNVSNHGKR